MSTILMEIQPDVIKYAEAIADVIKVDVEITDENFVRIAGTGRFKEKLSLSIAKEAFVHKRALETGEIQVVDSPGRHPLCESCPNRGICDEEFEISAPIKLNGGIIGIIGLVCFDEIQKIKLVENLGAYLKFLEKISEFISAKASEKIEREKIELTLRILNQIIEKVDEGIIILSRDHRITSINLSALGQLKLTKKVIGEKADLRSTGDSVLNSDEFKLDIKNKNFTLVGELSQIGFDDTYHSLFVFKEIKHIKAVFYNPPEIGKNDGLSNIVGVSEAILALKQRVKKVAGSSSTVLISGESGTGKEVFARAIWKQSARRNKPFVAVNCAAIPDALLESEFFGYVKGSFTGADPGGRLGKFELANGGIIFLDEIGDMPLYLQIKILRVLQERIITRIGSNQQIDIDIRVIAATNKNLTEMIRQNKFREDLYYRLNVIPINIPPLREHPEDIEVLLFKFIDRYSRLLSKDFLSIEPAALSILKSYRWPGNVRELENTAEYLVNMMDRDGVITKELILPSITGSGRDKTPPADIKTLEELERAEIEKALKLCSGTKGDKLEAAQKLGIGIATLYRKIEKYGLMNLSK